MPLSDLTLSIESFLVYQDKTFRIEDTYDYAGESIPLSQLAGTYTATQVDTGDVFHNNVDFDNPDIEQSVSLESDPIDFPTDDETGFPLLGDIEVVYRLQRTLEAPVAVVTESGGDWGYLVPSGDFPAGLEVGQTLVASGFDEPENNGTFVITAITPGVSYFVAVAETLVAEAGAEGQILVELEYTKTFNFNYAYVAPEVKIEMTHSCKTFSIKSVDSTAMGNPTTLVRLHTLKYPQGLGDQQPPDIVSSAKIITAGPPIWTTTWTTVLSLTATYEQDDGLTVEVVLSGSKDHIVSCISTAICCLLPNIMNLTAKFVKEKDKAQRSYYTNVLLQITSYVQQIEKNEECGNADEAESLYNELKDILKREGYDCSGCDCGCSDTGTPQELSTDSYAVIGASAVSVVPISPFIATNVQAFLEEIVANGVLPDPGNAGQTLQNVAGAWAAGVILQEGSETNQSAIWDGTKWIGGPKSYPKVLSIQNLIFSDPTQPDPVTIEGNTLVTDEGVMISGWIRGTQVLSVVRVAVGANNFDIPIGNTSSYMNVWILRNGDNIEISAAFITVTGSTPAPVAISAAHDFTANTIVQVSDLNDSFIGGLSFQMFKLQS